MTAKKEAWKWCSLYIRLRDAIEHQKNYPDQPFGNVKCCTCHRVIPWRATGRGKSECDAGHFIRRGLGGGSGVYFDEKNIHAQCKRCNLWDPDMEPRYLDFMLEKYGQNTVDLLKFMDKNHNYNRKIVQTGLMYQQMFEELKKGTGLAL